MVIGGKLGLMATSLGNPCILDIIWGTNTVFDELRIDKIAEPMPNSGWYKPTRLLHARTEAMAGVYET